MLVVNLKIELSISYKKYFFKLFLKVLRLLLRLSVSGGFVLKGWTNSDAESTSHLLLYFSPFTTERLILLSTLNNIDQTFLENTDQTLTNILHFDDTSFDRAFNS